MALQGACPCGEGPQGVSTGRRRHARSKLCLAFPTIARGMRLLVAEDDPILSDALSHALRAAGHAVDAVADGAAADAALATSPFDVVILDLGLPRMDGLEVLRRLRSRRATV